MRVSAVAVAALYMGLAAGGLAVGGLSSVTPAMAQASPDAADIQWAQQTLKNQGYDIGGKASNRMTPGARRAISQFQSRNGLPATGELTPATIQALMGAGKPAATMGVLGKTKSSESLGGAASSSAPPKPTAVPTQRIGGAGDADKPLSSVTLGGGGAGGGAAGGFTSSGGGPAVRAAPAATVEPSGGANGESMPQAAPRAAVEGDVAAGMGTGTDGGSFLDGGIPNWARYALWAVLGVLGLGMLVGWALSGRKRASYEEPAADRPMAGSRREPVFERAAEPLTAGLPPLTAPSRRSR